MSRRIKPYRIVVDRGATIETIHVIEYPGVPEELVATMIRVRNSLWRASSRLGEELYR